MFIKHELAYNINVNKIIEQFKSLTPKKKKNGTMNFYI